MIAYNIAAPTVDPLWNALAQLGPHPAPAWQWRRLLTIDPTECRFLLRAAQLADAVPCPHACGCGQLHRIEEIFPGEFCAIPEADDCESAPILRDELAVYSLDATRLAAAVARALPLHPEISPTGDTSGTIRLGVRADAASPVYLSFPLRPQSTVTLAHTLAASVRGPFTLLVPVADFLTHAAHEALAAHSATGAALAVLIRSPFDAAWAVAELPPTLRAPDTVTSKPAPAPAPSIASRRLGNTWSYARPENPTWRDVKLTLHSQEVAITFGPSQAKFDFRQIDGFTDQRGGKRPNRLWALLRAFALRDGVLSLPTKDDDPVRVRTLRELDTVLQRFFGLRSSAFSKLADEQRVRCLFLVRAPD